MKLLIWIVILTFIPVVISECGTWGNGKSQRIMGLQKLRGNFNQYSANQCYINNIVDTVFKHPWNQLQKEGRLKIWGHHSTAGCNELYVELSVNGYCKNVQSKIPDGCCNGADNPLCGKKLYDFGESIKRALTVAGLTYTRFVWELNQNFVIEIYV